MPIIGKGAARILGIDLDKVPEKTVHSTDWLECDDCREKKEDVKETICPYNEDRKGIITKCKLCKLCYHERCMQRY
jgi:hypothetical protein